jgi:NAD(P)H-quinone oxidoreductase subunit 5
MLAETTTAPLYLAAVVLVPLLLLAAGLVPNRVANRLGARFASLASGVALAALGLAALAALGRAISGPLAVGIAGAGPLRIDFYFDTLTAVMLLLVTFLGAVVLRFSRELPRRRSGARPILSWLAVTIGSVLTLVGVRQSPDVHARLDGDQHEPASVAHLLPGAAGGDARSSKEIPHQPARRRLPRRRACAYLAVLWQLAIHRDLRCGGRSAGERRTRCVPRLVECVLLVAGALLKSAQFPFHSWLPDTMETPTPVSALMHAGIINAGGFLIVRLSPVIASAPMALNALAIVGALTALFASVVMLTQTNVKRSLAYSTIAQMGFMMLQCGSGPLLSLSCTSSRIRSTRPTRFFPPAPS